MYLSSVYDITTVDIKLDDVITFRTRICCINVGLMFLFYLGVGIHKPNISLVQAFIIVFDGPR